MRFGVITGRFCRFISAVGFLLLQVQAVRLQNSLFIHILKPQLLAKGAVSLESRHLFK